MCDFSDSLWFLMRGENADTNAVRLTKNLTGWQRSQIVFSSVCSNDVTVCSWICYLRLRFQNYTLE